MVSFRNGKVEIDIKNILNVKLDEDFFVSICKWYDTRKENFVLLPDAQYGIHVSVPGLGEER